MTHDGILEFKERLIGAYLSFFRNLDPQMKKARDESIKYDFANYSDEDVMFALTRYKETDSRGFPPSNSQLIAIINSRRRPAAEQDWDRTRIFEDADGRIWYNEEYVEEKSKRDPSRTILRPTGNRPLNGRKGFHQVRTPYTNEQLVEISRKNGWEYSVTEKDEIKYYEFDEAKIRDFIEREERSYV